ncbi:MAG: histone H1 [Betaproteobacteria bacterium]|nr:MAG: histone H1 [Betaproteobacteria bacterium]
MATRPKRPRDPNQLAALIVGISIGEVEDVDPDTGKDPAAISRGKLGGFKGGKARADSLSRQERSEIAKKAASARWAKK